MLRCLALALVALCLGERLLGAAWSPADERVVHADASRVFLARDGSLLRVEPNAAGERCLPVPLADVSPHVVQALICAEDRRFREHSGVDVLAMARAAVRNAATGRVTSGASTLTMQLARIAAACPRDLAGKVRQALIARRIERRLGKDEILEAYLNRVPFGGTTRGIEAAAWRWFGKRSRDLDLGESAALVAMLPAPTARAPDLGGAERLRAARREVLERMEREGAIDARTRAAAERSPLPERRLGWPYRAPHACDLFGAAAHGPVVATTIDLALQTRIEEIAREPAPEIADGLAVVALDRADGTVRALLGSRDYRTHPLDAALCRRSAGSTLKPFLYALAVEQGALGPDSIVRDVPLRYDDYAPRNFEGRHLGAMPAAEALAASRNVPAVRTLQAAGPARFVDLLRTLGLRPPEHAVHVDAALGTLAVSPLELATAYQRFAGPGEVPGLSRRARDAAVGALGLRSPDASRLPEGAVAWKTGTSSGRRDAWCVGVTSHHVMVVWLGRLDGRPVPDLVGGRAAADLLVRLVSAL